MKVGIIGSNGQLGTDLKEALAKDHEIIELNHDRIEITDMDSVREILSQAKPDLVINTAAYHVVPQCEQFPEKAYQINGIGALNLARFCQDSGIQLLHYSTDYVFDGKKASPYVENDYCNPLNVYATTKLSGEHYVLNYCERSYVVRVSGIYGKIPSRAKGGNFVTTMLKLAKEKPEVRVVNDEFLTPTPTKAIAMNTLALIRKQAFGLYHMSCQGEVSWYEFARAIWEKLQLKTPLFPASVTDFPLVVKRPFYSVLENQNLKALDIDLMPDWKSALGEFLDENFAA